MNKNTLVIIIISMGAFNLGAQIDTLYVNLNASGNNSGSSWVNAYSYLGDALKNAKKGDNIWVAKGIYEPKDSDPFEIHTSFKLLGGFKGDENDVIKRNWKINETILQTNKLGNFEFRSNVLFVSNTDTTALIDGFIIQNGNASFPMYDPPLPTDPTCENNPYNYRACNGGGIFMQSIATDQPVFLNIFNCIFRNNFAIAGGAIGIDSYSGIGGVNINNCEFIKNKASYETGGIFMHFGPDNIFPTTIDNTIFKENSCYETIGALDYTSFDPNGKFELKNSQFIKNKTSLLGAGAVFHENINKTGSLIKNCTFEENICGINKFFPGRGGAVHGYYTNFQNCIFTKNIAWQGGAIYGTSNVFVNCIFSKNHSYNVGGCLFTNAQGILDSNKIINCNFYNNRSENKGGAIYNFHNQKLRIYNSIFSGNSAKLSSNNIFSEISPSIHIANNMFDESILDSLVISDSLKANFLKIDTSSIILESPIYWDTLNADFRIANCSKAIDAGNIEWTKLVDLNNDYNDGPRIKNIQPDLGAFEMDKFISFDTVIINASNTQSKDGSIKLENINGFKPPLTYIWNTGSKDSSISMLKAGTYGVFIEDSLQCSGSFYFNVSSMTSTNSIVSLTEVSINPNLVKYNFGNPKLKVISSENQSLNFNLYNSNGQILRQGLFKINVGLNEMEIPKVGPGIFFVSLENNLHQKNTVRFIVID